MTAKPREKPVPAAERRLALACSLIRRERHRQRASAVEFCERVGISVSTLSKIENKRYVSPDTVIDVGLALEWGSFLDFVIAGSYEEAEQSGNVHDDIRRWERKELREIAAETGNG